MGKSNNVFYSLFPGQHGYHVMDEEGNRSGYGYDFLRLMARYWDVDYEYDFYRAGHFCHTVRTGGSECSRFQ